MKIDKQYVANAAFHYLGRFSSSEANLRRVLERKLLRKIRRMQSDTSEQSEGHGDYASGLSTEQRDWIEQAIKRCIDYGYIDDRRYARERARQLLNRGKSLRLIQANLQSKGISANHAKAAIDDVSEASFDDKQASERYAVARYIKRRRFGPFRTVTRKEGADISQKELASLARAGFSYALSREILSLDEEELNVIIDSAKLV